MKKSIMMAVLVALVGQAQAVLMDVSHVLHVSTAGGDELGIYPGSSEGFSSFGPEAWRQEDGHGTILEGYSIGTVFAFYPGDETTASQGWFFENSAAEMSWSGSAGLLGEGSFNLSELRFTLYEPVAYTITSETLSSVLGYEKSVGLEGISGSNGILGIGSYIFSYSEMITAGDGSARSTTQFTMTSVPESGGTLAMLGVGVMAILTIRRANFAAKE